LEKYINSRTQIQEFTETPFKQYPLPASPFKPISLHPSMTTPIHRKFSLSPLSLKPMLGENDIFAISPGMFPRKAKTLDYLDILADAERKEFISPIKTMSVNLVVPRETPTSEQNDVDISIGPMVEDIDVGVNTNKDAEGTHNFKLC
jgi:hypothetical protein